MKKMSVILLFASALIGGIVRGADMIPEITQTAAFWVDADSITNEVGSGVERWYDRRETNFAAPIFPCATNRWTASTTQAGVAPELQMLNGHKAVWFGDFDGRWMQWTKRVYDIRHVFIVHGVNRVWGPLLGWTKSRNGGFVINTGTSVVANATQYFTARADLSCEYLGADYRRDGQAFDPFTTAPLTSHEELFSIDFTHAVSRADRFMHTTFESQYRNGTELGVLGGGWIVEALIFTNRLQDAEVKAIEQYLMAKHTLPEQVRRDADNGYVRPADEVETLADGRLVARGMLLPPVEVEKGDYLITDSYKPLSARTLDTKEWDLKTGTELTRQSSSRDRICKSGAGRAAINAIPEGVARLSVESGALALEAVASAAVVELPIAAERGVVEVTNFTLTANGEVETTVSLSGGGLYELSMIAREKYGTRANTKIGLNNKIAAENGKFQEVAIYFDDSAEPVGYCRALGREDFRYRFRLPFVAAAGTKRIRLKSIANQSDAETYIRGLEVNPLERRESPATFKIPNGDFENFDLYPNAGKFVGWYNITSNQIPGWVFHDWSTKWPGAEYNASAGIVSPVFTYFINSSGVDSSPIWNFAGRPYGSAALALLSNQGSAETTFTAPAGEFYLKASLARWDCYGQAYTNLCSQKATSKEVSYANVPKVVAKLIVGAVTNELGTVSVGSYLCKDYLWPKSVTFATSQPVTLVLSQSSVSGVSIDDLALENRVDAFRVKGELVTNGDFESGNARWSSSNGINIHTNARVTCGCAYHTSSVSAYGHALRPVGNHSCWFFIGGTIAQEIDFLSAGTYRFSAHIRTRADGAHYGRQRFQFWTCKSGTTATNVVAKTFAEEYCQNYREHAYYFTIPEAGKYLVGLESIGPLPPLNVNGLGNPDHTSYVDDISVKCVADELSAPKGFASTAVDVASGAHLILDYTGVVSVASLKLEGVQIPVGIYTSADYPEFLQGAGAVSVLTCPPPADPIHVTLSLDSTGGVFTDASGIRFSTPSNLEVAVGTPHGQVAALPTPRKPGFTFLGWYDGDGNRVYDATEILDTTNFTISARWQWPRGDQTKYPRSALDAIDLPLLVIDTVDGEEPDYGVAIHPPGCNGEGIKFATKVPGRMKIFRRGEELYDSGEYVKKTSGITIKIRGNTSAGSSKKPYKLKLQSEADLLFRNDGKNHADKDWILLAGTTHLKNIVGFMVNEIVGLDWTPGIQHVNVIVNGDYRGLYQLVESVSESECRLNVSNGYLFEYDAYWWNEPTYFKIVNGRYNAGYTFKYPDSDGYPDDSDLTPKQILSLSNSVELAYLSIFDGTYTNRIHSRSWARWMLGRDILGANDGAGSNYYFTKKDDQPTTKIKMANLWDFDSDYVCTSRWSTVHSSNYFYFGDLMTNVTKCFNNAYVKTWNEVKDAVVTNVTAQLEAKVASGEAAAIDAAREYNRLRWGGTAPTFAQSMTQSLSYLTDRIPWIQSRIGEFATDDTPDPDDEPEVEPVPTDWKGDFADPVTLPPGAYNLKGANFNGGLILADGEFELKNDGAKTVNSAAFVSGPGATVFFKGKGTLQLTATTGTAFEADEIIVSNGVIKSSGLIKTSGKFMVDDKGTVEIVSTGVCLNPTKKFSVAGNGRFYAYSTGDHAVKCGKNAEFSGGIMLAYATAAGKCGLALESKRTITVTGGIVVSVGGEGSEYVGVPENAFYLPVHPLTGNEGPYLTIRADAGSDWLDTTVMLPEPVGESVTIFAYGDNWQKVVPFKTTLSSGATSLKFHDTYQEIRLRGTLYYVR